MTNNEAIKWLGNLRNDLGNPHYERLWLYVQAIDEICELLEEHEPRVMTLDEWREWKNNPKRNPICELWEHDTSPMWVLNPDTIHEPALLMGKLKLFTGKPTFEQCKAVKWE